MWSAVVEMQSHRTTVPHYDRERMIIIHSAITAL